MNKSTNFTARCSVLVHSPSFSATSQVQSTNWILLSNCGDCLLQWGGPWRSFTFNQDKMSIVYSLPKVGPS